MMPSGSELLVIVLAILILFGGKKLPEIARSIGKGLRELQKASQDFKRELDLDDLDRDEKDKPELKG